MIVLTRSQQLPPTLNRRHYAADLREARRRAAAGELSALILPLIEADGRWSRVLIVDPATRAVRARFKRRPRWRRTGVRREPVTVWVGHEMTTS